MGPILNSFSYIAISLYLVRIQGEYSNCILIIWSSGSLRLAYMFPLPNISKIIALRRTEKVCDQIFLIFSCCAACSLARVIVDHWTRRQHGDHLLHFGSVGLLQR